MTSTTTSVTADDTVAASAELAHRATEAYRFEERARARRLAEDAQPDLRALLAKLAELDITPLGEPWITSDGTVAVRIAEIGVTDLVDEDGERPPARSLCAAARSGRISLRSTGEVGELHSLADVGRAIWESPATSPLARPDYAGLANQQLDHLGVPDGEGAAAICEAVTALTYAVLAVADELREAGHR